MDEDEKDGGCLWSELETPVACVGAEFSFLVKSGNAS